MIDVVFHMYMRCAVGDVFFFSASDSHHLRRALRSFCRHIACASYGRCRAFFSVCVIRVAVRGFYSVVIDDNFWNDARRRGLLRRQAASATTTI
ncbi:hypothetical protein ANCCAN_05518 [Ancylostoma caninum]|uniref:Uncharacterized protein n=1 Tax=Ancylostoma caninum TaxID=29170 RepID=A0A368GZE5_ANCCA|nr:hypothetical protein ANCCAN_05518 [Ancylostoma caninum]